jgi:molybdenum cofactor cytidylyltransferase
MCQLAGDKGARQLIADYAEAVCEVAMTGDGVLLDIDEPQALEQFRNRLGGMPV